MDHGKILRGIIDDLMKVPMAHNESDPMEPAPGLEGAEPKETHVEIMAEGKPEHGDLEPSSLDPMKKSSHLHQMKKLHSMKK